jgi:predicted transposase/invertase (TIGR01784 family)
MIMRLSEERYDNPAYRDIKNSIDTAKEEGREEGREEGIAKEKLATAKRLLGMGLTQEQVAKGTDLSIEDIERLV